MKKLTNNALREIMIKMLFYTFLLGISLFFSLDSLAQQLAKKDLKPLLPPEIYAVPGVRMNVYFRNTILCRTPSDYKFNVECPAGGVTTDNEGRWSLYLQKNISGRFPFKLSISNNKGKLLHESKSTLVVSPENAGADRKIKLLLIGDSFTHQSKYPNRLAALLSRPGNPEWKMLGTQKPKERWFAAKKGVAHEGYGGWAWITFVTKYSREPIDRLGPSRKRPSPFVFKDPKSRKKYLSVKRYLQDNYNGEKPDFITIMLGINANLAGATEKNAESRFQKEFKYADILLNELRKVCPNAIIGICITVPPQADKKNYKGELWGRYIWLRAQHQFVKHMIKRFKGREQENIYLIPTELNLDVDSGFPQFNICHPNRHGYYQIGDTIYCWLKAMLNKQKNKQKGE